MSKLNLVVTALTIILFCMGVYLVTIAVQNIADLGLPKWFDGLNDAITMVAAGFFLIGISAGIFIREIFNLRNGRTSVR